MGATARAWSAGPPTLQTCGAPGSCGQSCACPVGWQCGDLAEQTVCFPDGVCRRGSPSCGAQQQSGVQLHDQGDRLPCNCMAVHEPVSCGGRTFTNACVASCSGCDAPAAGDSSACPAADPELWSSPTVSFRTCVNTVGYECPAAVVHLDPRHARLCRHLCERCPCATDLASQDAGDIARVKSACAALERPFPPGAGVTSCADRAFADLHRRPHYGEEMMDGQQQLSASQKQFVRLAAASFAHALERPEHHQGQPSVSVRVPICQQQCEGQRPDPVACLLPAGDPSILDGGFATFDSRCVAECALDGGSYAQRCIASGGHGDGKLLDLRHTATHLAKMCMSEREGLCPAGHAFDAELERCAPTTCDSAGACPSGFTCQPSAPRCRASGVCTHFTCSASPPADVPTPPPTAPETSEPTPVQASFAFPEETVASMRAGGRLEALQQALALELGVDASLIKVNAVATFDFRAADNSRRLAPRFGVGGTVQEWGVQISFEVMLPSWPSASYTVKKMLTKVFMSAFIAAYVKIMKDSYGLTVVDPVITLIEAHSAPKTCGPTSNCYIGDMDGTWHAGVTSWSRTQFPQFPQQVRIEDKRVVAAEEVSSAGLEIVLEDGKLILDDQVVLGPSECDATEHEVAAPTATSDRNCRASIKCNYDEWQVSPHTATSPAVCKAYTTCKADEWETSPPAAQSDRACHPHTVCVGDEYETKTAGTHSDRVCASHTTCAALQWESKASGTHHDRECTVLTTCTATQWISTAKTITSDRVCTEHTTCTGTQWETKSSGVRHDRECTSHTTCQTDEWQTKASGTHHDRVCQAHTTCEATQWETKASGTHHDRECTAHTTCASTEWQTKAHGTHHDRECRSCSAEAACLPWEVRAGCGGVSPGRCEFDCAGSTNCFVGTSGSRWFASVGGWSLTHFPAYAEYVLVNRDVQLLDRARGASREVFIGDDGQIDIDDSGELQIGPRACDASERTVLPPSDSTDRTCSDNVVCTAGQWESRAQTRLRNRECRDWTVCSATQLETKAPGTHHDRECQGHTVCTKTQWETKASGTHHDRVCQDHTTCTATQYETVAAATHSDRSCAAHTTCEGAQWQTKASGTHHDRECQGHTTCTGTQWQTKAHGTHHDRECQDHTICTGTQWQTKAHGTHHDRECQAHTVCSATQWQTKASGTHVDRECADHTVCAATQWQTKASGTHHDRVCQAHTTCTATQWETVASGTHHDRECKAHTTCTATQWQTVAAGTHNDRECKEHTVCTGTEYQTKASGTHHDRVCASHEVCAADQWESKASGTHHDRECTAMTVCTATQRETTALALTSDRECQAHTTCSATQWETKASGTHHDRTCQAHMASSGVRLS